MIYFDNAATSGKKPEEVYRAVDDCLRNLSANPGRSGHELAISASRLVFESRVAVANLIGATNCDNIVFTSNATESINIALKGYLNPGDHVITTSMEHNSIIRPLRYLQRNCDVEVDILQCDSDGNLDIAALERAFKPNTRLVAVIHGSNITGGIFPAKEIARVVHEHDCALLLDGAQTVGYVDFDVEEMGIDLLAFSGHKALMGPMGIGCLYVRSGMEVRGIKHGGTGSRSEDEEHPDFLPDRLEAGTPNLPAIAGLKASIEILKKIGIESVRNHEAGLAERLADGLGFIRGVRILGRGFKGTRCPMISFVIEGVDPAQVGLSLEKEYGILSRVGLCCAPLAHRTLGTYPAGAVRLSIGYFNTSEEIDRVVRAVEEIGIGRRC